MAHTLPFPKLLDAHKARLARFQREASKPLQARARYLLAHLKAELGLSALRVDYCNGDHWLAPADTSILFRDKDGETYPRTLRHALDAHALGHDEPALSPRGLRYLCELHDLCAFSAYSQLHTVEAVMESV